MKRSSFEGNLRKNLLASTQSPLGSNNIQALNRNQSHFSAREGVPGTQSLNTRVEQIRDGNKIYSRASQGITIQQLKMLNSGWDKG
jgi:hypothetical protein